MDSSRPIMASAIHRQHRRQRGQRTRRSANDYLPNPFATEPQNTRAIMEFGSDYVYINAYEESESDSDQDDELAPPGSPASWTSPATEYVDDGETCLLDILDTAGQEEYSFMREYYIKHGDGVIIVYDVSDVASFKQAEQIYWWTKRIKGADRVPAVLCANKSDLHSDLRQVSTEAGREMARRHDLLFFETSAKTNQNIEEAIHELVRHIPRRRKDYRLAALGSGGVGKSSIVIRFMQDVFLDAYDPTIEDSFRKQVVIKGIPRPRDHKKDHHGIGAKIKRFFSFRKSREDSTETDIKREYAPVVNKRDKRRSANLHNGPVSPPPPVPEHATCTNGHGHEHHNHNHNTLQPSPEPNPRQPEAGATNQPQDDAERKTQTPPNKAKSDSTHQDTDPKPDVSHEHGACVDDKTIIPAEDTDGKVNAENGEHEQDNEANEKNEKCLTIDVPRKRKKASGNVVVVTMTTLEKESIIMGGQPVVCNNCQIAISSVSNFECADDGVKWTCQFCGQEQEEKDVNLRDRIPKDPNVDYMVAPPEGSLEQQSKGVILYCIDVSTSMGSTFRIPSLQAQWRVAKGEQPKKFITRMECVRQAILRQLERIHIETPDKKVAIVTFGTQVTIRGDGSQPVRVIHGNDLEDFDTLMEIGKRIASEMMLVPILRSFRTLKEIVRSLEEEGMTALGPALTLSTGMVSNWPFSEVVLCTDGQPNRALGALENRSSRTFDPEFYEKIGEYASSNKTKLSIISLEGEEVQMQYIGRCAQITSGTINILNPLELMRQIRLIAQNPVIATGVEVTFFLHPALRFDRATDSQVGDLDNQGGDLENGDPQSSKVGGSEDDLEMESHKVKKVIGNATRQTDLVFSYERNPNYTGEIPRIVPFQVQIRYTRQSGFTYFKIITMEREVTSDRMKMGESIHIAVTGMAAVHRAAVLAEEGKYVDARHHLLSVQKLLVNGAQTSRQQEEIYNFKTEATELDQHLAHYMNVLPGEVGAVGGAPHPDRTARVLYDKMNTSLDRYLNIMDRMENIKSRRTESQKLREQYYAYVF